VNNDRNIFILGFTLMQARAPANHTLEQ